MTAAILRPRPLKMQGAHFARSKNFQHSDTVLLSRELLLFFFRGRGWHRFLLSSMPIL